MSAGIKKGSGAFLKKVPGPFFMRREGVEPSYLAAQASETCVSAISPPPPKVRV